MGYTTRVTFTIGEQESGQLYLQMVFLDALPPFLESPPIFDLPPGMSMKRAEEVASYLNDIAAVFQTSPLEVISHLKSMIDS